MPSGLRLPSALPARLGALPYRDSRRGRASRPDHYANCHLLRARPERASVSLDTEEIPTMIRIGIDVGGTNTDAVVMDGTDVLAGVKAATTGDVMSGVVAALKAVLSAAASSNPRAIDVVMIGTTHFTNAVVQRRDLAQTAAVRLGLPATASLPPMVDWPDDLKAAIGGHYYHGARRPRVRRPRDLRARRAGASRHRRGHPRQGRPRGGDLVRVQSRQHGMRDACARHPAEGAARTRISRCRATSAASACSSARTRRS